MRRSFIRKDFRSILFLGSLALIIGLVVHIVLLNISGHVESSIIKVVRFVALFIAVSLFFSSWGSLLDVRRRERLSS